MTAWQIRKANWYSEHRNWIVYLLTKGNYSYVGITSKSLKARLRKHKEMSQNPTRYTPLNQMMKILGTANWRIKKLADVVGDFYKAREVERSFMFLSNLNEEY